MLPVSSFRLDRNAVEKTRRKKMKEHLSTLYSLIPIQPSKQRLPLVVLLDKATTYIEQLKEKIEIGKRRKEQLEGGETANLILPAVLEVRETSSSTLEVTLVTGPNKRVMLHQLVHVLEAEATAQVLSASYSNVGDKIIFTIYSEAIWPSIGIETSELHERLKELIF